MLVYKDTTFRDGLQGKGVDATDIQEVLRAIQAIDRLGVSYHEVGFAVANSGSRERIRQACEMSLSGKVAAFGRTHLDDVSAMIELKVPAGTLVGKTRRTDAEQALRLSPHDNLTLIGKSISALVEAGIEVIYDAEHAFQAFVEDDKAYALKTLEVAKSAGAKWIVLCDTNGKSTPGQIAAVLNMIAPHIPVSRLGIHTHNDRGRAVACAEAALSCGIGLVEGTIGGFGERTGNMDLCTFMANAFFDHHVHSISASQLRQLTSVYFLVCDVLNLTPSSNMPWVGPDAFYTEAGMHQSGLTRQPGSYFHADPASVGNHSSVGVTGQSGKANIESKAAEFGVEVVSAELKQLAREHQVLVDEGGDFGLADASFHLWLLRQLGRVPEQLPTFLSFRAIIEKQAEGSVATEASLRLLIDGKPKLYNADGDGPVNALDEVLRRTLRRRFPELMHVRLGDFRVRIVDSGRGTAAKVRVRITFTDGTKTWTTMAVHENIIEASWNALWDGYLYKLIVNGNK
jgi:2-isopropylmalate synthase